MYLYICFHVFFPLPLREHRGGNFGFSRVWDKFGRVLQCSPEEHLDEFSNGTGGSHGDPRLLERVTFKPIHHLDK